MPEAVNLSIVTNHDLFSPKTFKANPQRGPSKPVMNEHRKLTPKVTPNVYTTNKLVSTKYKGFCARLGPQRKSRPLKGLVEFTKKN